LAKLKNPHHAPRNLVFDYSRFVFAYNHGLVKIRKFLGLEQYGRVDQHLNETGHRIISEYIMSVVDPTILDE